jgi:NADPH:quinone reductase-like Zn-dependent oxidoreductase
MRGLTAAYLMRRIWDFKKGDTILLHAAAGGVGLLVSQWAKLGLNVIGTSPAMPRPKCQGQRLRSHPSTVLA